MPRLIATDLDGTLLASDHRSISPRNRNAVAAATQRGIPVIAVSGRQPCSIASIVVGAALESFVIGSNGSVGMDLVSRVVQFEERLDVRAQTEFVHAMKGRFPHVKVTTVHDGGNVYLAEHGYDGEQDPGVAAAAWPVVHRLTDLEEVLARPAVKLVVKDPEVLPSELLLAAEELAIPGCQPTVSGAPFLEVSRAGVTKASGLARVCQGLGVAAADVMALGDNSNDVEMLVWAGYSVAMGNATQDAVAVAQAVTATNDEDGFAQAVERVLG